MEINSHSNIGSSLVFIIGVDLVFRSMYMYVHNLMKFARCHTEQNGNMCKIDHQAFFDVKVLNETHLLLIV